jgi:hypothetical protein
MFIQPHNEAGYTSAVVTGNPDPADMLQSGGVHIRPHMTRRGRRRMLHIDAKVCSHNEKPDRYAAAI